MKALKGILSVFIIFILSLAFASTSFARHAQVLGVSAQETTPALPLSQGAGLLLPNSPFYFIDLWRDNLSLLLASFDGEAKARLHTKIAAERIVEVKLMLEGKNVSAAGLDTALNSITQNIEGAKVVIKSKKNQGQPVEKLAAEINQILDNQQQALKIILKISDDRIKLKIKAVQKAIEEDEVEIEDELAEDELGDEINEELEEEIKDEVEGASESARRVELLLTRLEEEASRSAQKALRKREEALRRAIEKQNKEQERAGEQLKKDEERKIEQLRKSQEESAEEARKAAKEAQKAAERLRKSQEKVSEIRAGGESSGGGSSGSSGGSVEEKKSESSGSSGSSGSNKSGKD